MTAMASNSVPMAVAMLIAKWELERRRYEEESAAEAGKRLGLSPRTLANLRSRRMGPPYLRVVGHIRYRVSDLAEWLDGRVQVPGADQ